MQIKELELAELIYAREYIYEDNWFSGVHSHGHTEIFCITQGEGFFSLAGNRILVKKGDFLIVNANVPHTEFSSSEGAMGYIVLGIKNAELYISEQNEGFFHIRNSRLSLKGTGIFREILSEFEGKEALSEELCQGFLRVAILYILQNAENRVLIKEPSAVGSKECAEVKRYIDSHFKDAITLEKLSKIAHINKFYLVHSFKKAYGMTPINYLQLCRINEARHLLLETDMPVSQIAQAVGFSGASSFTQCFKKMVNLTPSQLRKTSK